MQIFKKSHYIFIKLEFDLFLEVKAIREVDGLGLVIKITDAKFSVSDVKSKDGSADWIVDTYINYITLWTKSFGGILNDYIGKTFTLVPISTFNGQTADSIIAQVDPVQEANRLLQSAPFDFNFSYDGTNSSYQKLIIDLKMLHGYYENGVFNHKYLSWEPDPVINTTFQWGGFGLNGDVYNLASKLYGSLPWETLVDTTFRLIKDMGLNYVRIDAIWNQIDYSVNNVSSSLNPSSITSTDVNNYIAEIESEGGWYKIGYVINSAKRHGLIPYVIVGCGHEDAPPHYNGKIIAPGSAVRSNNPNDLVKFVAVPKNAYLYWLKLHTRAVVKYFTPIENGGVIYWQAENELNGARFMETYDWWRKGDAWAEDWDGGFQDQVAEMMYNAIKAENSSAQVIQDFHLFTLSRRLETWRGWYDVVGLNAYPNEMAAYPILGFLNGELVWSTRRILKYLGQQYGSQYKNKQIWFIETGYGGKFAQGDVTFESFIDSCKYYYSYDRQQQFLEEALNSCAKYGADAFNWLLPITPDDINSNFRTLSDINGFCGLFNNSGNPKPAYQTYINAFATNSNGQSVTFKNTNNGTNIGGTLSIDKVIRGIKSGSNFKLDASTNFTVLTDNDQLLNSTQTAIVKHHDWNANNDHYLLKHVYNYNTYGSQEIAIFQDVSPINFSTNVSGQNNLEIAKKIAIRDPWYVNSLNQQLNQFYRLEMTTDTTIYQVFLKQNPSQGMKYYSIKAPICGGADQSYLYEFNHWEASGGQVDFLDGTGSRETRVVFHNANTTIKAVYSPVNNIQNHTLVIPYDELLSIPPGANIQCADGFKINVIGALDAVGSDDDPVILTGSGMSGTVYDPMNNYPPSGTELISANAVSAVCLNHVILKDLKCGIFVGDQVEQNVFLNNVEIKNCNVGIRVGKTDDARFALDNCHIHDCNTGILFDRDFSQYTQNT
ncbi:MAG: hypothetical protein JXB49_12990, partial [Bacteroidales bacterium]|nr:hypothetical protein [Bacteroidales bacterium]